MSEKKTNNVASNKLETVITYDPKNIITGIEISTAYITGFQRILTTMMLSTEKPEELPNMFKKFYKIANTKNEDFDAENKDLQLDTYEADVYTLFSFLQLLKYLAKKQGFEIHNETKATTEDLNELAKLITSGADISEKIKDFNSKIVVKK